MVAGKVQQQQQMQQKQSTRSQKTAAIASRKQTPLPLHPPPLPLPSSRTVFGRSFGVYFPRATAQVQPRSPDVNELIKVVEELRDREAQLKTEILELKIANESVAVLARMEKEIENSEFEVERLKRRVKELEMENDGLKSEVVEMRRRLEEMAILATKTTIAAVETTTFLSSSSMSRTVKKTAALAFETATDAPETTAFMRLNTEAEELSMSRRFQGLIDASVKSNLIRNLKKSAASAKTNPINSNRSRRDAEAEDNAVSTTSDQPQAARVSNPSLKSTLSTSQSLCPKLATSPVPPPPPPPPTSKTAAVAGRVKRVPEVVEFYHWLMRRNSRREPNGAVEEVSSVVQKCTDSRDMIGEIENRSAYSLAIKKDVETKGDFIRTLIKEVRNAVFSSIDDVLPFVKWLDEELSLLVDERAVLKHFDWPEQKADALREAAFGYSDFKKLESEATLFRDDPRQSCGSALKKMQALFEKLEHGVHNLSHLKESSTKKYKIFQIPLDWMLEGGLVSQMKLASVKLAMKYMKRVSAELESVTGGTEEVELIIRGVKFAFRVHQFAGGFDAETMTAFKEMKDKARTCGLQCHGQQ